MWRPGRSLATLALAWGSLTAVPAPVAAHAGGPWGVELGGYESRDRKIYFRIHEAGESGSPPRAYYFTLGDPGAREPIRARSLEDPDTTFAARWDPPAWRMLCARLVPLQTAEGYELCTTIRAAPGPAGEAGAVYRLQVDLVSGDRRAKRDLRGSCHSLVAARGVYEIPGRAERLVILTYSGRGCTCEDIEEVVLLE